MVVEYKDSVQDQSSTTGTGGLTIAGIAPAGCRTLLSAHSNGATVRYRVNSPDQTQWENGQGIWTVSTNHLSRDVIFSSSNSNNLVNFTMTPLTVATVLTAKDMTDLQDTPLFTSVGGILITNLGNVVVAK